MSGNTNQILPKANRLYGRLTATLRLFLCLQKNHNLTTDLLALGPPEYEETNPTARPISQPETCAPQSLATTAALPMTKAKFAVFCAGQEDRGLHPYLQNRYADGPRSTMLRSIADTASPCRSAHSRYDSDV